MLFREPLGVDSLSRTAVFPAYDVIRAFSALRFTHALLDTLLIQGFIALKLGIVAFIVPYMFVYQPALLGFGATSEILWAACTALVGVIGIAGGMQSWLLCSTSAWERAFLLIGGLTLIYPGLSTDIIGFGLLFSVGIVQMLRRRRAPIAA